MATTSIRTTLALAALSLLSACAAKEAEMRTVDYVDLERFMGDWYVIANIPTFLEKGAHNAIENYALNDDGTIATTFTFRADSFDGKPKKYTPKGFITNTETNATWGMRFIWPIKADYRIVYLDDEYSMTIIGRLKRDFVWIMARTPEIDGSRYDEMINLVRDAGYKLDELREVPQQWPQES